MIQVIQKLNHYPPILITFVKYDFLLLSQKILAARMKHFKSAKCQKVLAKLLLLFSTS